MAPEVDFITPTEPYDPMRAYYSRGLRERYRLDELKLPVVETPQVYADIKYETDKEKYLARAATRVRAGGLQKEVPAGWPKVLEGPLAWTTNDFNDETDFVLQLSSADNAEIVKALKHFKGDNCSGLTY